MKSLVDTNEIALEKNEFTGRLDSKVNLDFYNYGGNIIINPKYQEDIFASIAQYSQYNIVSADNITIETVTNDEKYGNWGLLMLIYLTTINFLLMFLF